MSESTKLCPKCSTVKTADEFYKNDNNSTGLHPCCKKCDKAYRDRWRENNRSNPRVRTLRVKYGMTLDEYEDLLDSQLGKCAICHNPETAMRRDGGGEVKYLAVDHDHSSGTVRGLLCQSCNTGIGLLREDISVLASAIAYLSRFDNPT